MKSAYNEIGLYHLMVIKEVKRWRKHNLISAEQFTAIGAAYKSPFFHPNFIIRILLFVAGLFALSGVTGLFFLFFSEMGDDGIAVMCIVYGVASFFFLKYVFIDKNHYKSGITEALLYHSIGFTLGGLAVASENSHFIFFMSVVVLTFAAIRYLDIVTTIGAVLTLAGFIFYEFYNLGGLAKNIIPFVIILVFTPAYFIARQARKNPAKGVWENNLYVVETLCLLLIYAAGNYYVVRELSINMMDLYLTEGEDIPFGSFFLALTVLIPVLYLLVGVQARDAVLLRVSLVAVGFSIFTFKYYFGFGHPEITLTLAGAFLFGAAYWVYHYLKVVRKGFTRENLLSEKWGSINVQAFVVSQTMGGNQVKAEDQFKGGGGTFGGGGASGNF